MVKGFIMVSLRSRNRLIGVALAFIGVTQVPAAAEEPAAAPARPSQASPNGIFWDLRENSSAKQADAWYDNYKFRDGETISRLRSMPRSERRIEMPVAISITQFSSCTGPAPIVGHSSVQPT
jgi:hypothetical protein